MQTLYNVLLIGVPHFYVEMSLFKEKYGKPILKECSKALDSERGSYRHFRQQSS